MTEYDFHIDTIHDKVHQKPLCFNFVAKVTFMSPGPRTFSFNTAAYWKLTIE